MDGQNQDKYPKFWSWVYQRPVTIHIKVKMTKLNQEPPAFSKVPNLDLKDMDALCTFKIKIESQKLEYGCTKDQWPYINQYQDAKPNSGTSSILQNPKLGIEGNGCSLQLQYQEREPKFRIFLYQRPVNISKSISRFQTLVRNLQHPSNPQVAN